VEKVKLSEESEGTAHAHDCSVSYFYSAKYLFCVERREIVEIN
jgi:hypothetical protein